MKCDSGIKLVFKFVKNVFPQVTDQLAYWNNLCHNAEDQMLIEQAASSLKQKKFHAQGGSVYALYPNVNMQNAIKFIVSFQTISDYLDNLCDRAGVKDESAFRQLHLSMLDAIDPQRPISNYYRYYPYKQDSNYLISLVEECRKQILKLPAHSLVLNILKKYVALYSELQTYKHLSPHVREHRMLGWANSYISQYPGISCWEFSAATGSTLGIFMLYAAAHDPALKEDEVHGIDSSYFPWINGLHILLDYYIDLQEDLVTDDLNFTYYYENLEQCEERLTFFLNQALTSCSKLRYPKFHITVIKGLLAMYLSDPKASNGLNRLTSRNLLRKGLSGTILYHNLCRILRSAKVI
ncbi:MAG: tetraprenyl-beta-curcumene synthase family protein [Clostridia bacterium]|nr:tetraprenyl-beta-curcumene synthase family protein [Clostridia bacterium]